jgi:hypothetical protein
MLIPRKRDWIQKRLSAKPAETEIVGHYPQNPFLLGANGGLSAHEMNGIGANTKNRDGLYRSNKEVCR